MKYQVKKQFSSNPTLVTSIGDKTVGLNGEIRVEIPATKTGPAKERVIPAATQSDLKALFLAGNPLIEEVEDAKEKA